MPFMSPKRKREHARASSEISQSQPIGTDQNKSSIASSKHQTDSANHSSKSPANCDDRRTNAVEGRFEDLTIEEGGKSNLQASNMDSLEGIEGAKKRKRMSEDEQGLKVVSATTTSTSASTTTTSTTTTTTTVIAAPGDPADKKELQHPSEDHSHTSDAGRVASAGQKDENPQQKQRSRIFSPPPVSSNEKQEQDRSSSGSDSLKEDNEVGDYSLGDRDDDGYGINGIGYKPTPQIAWARSQRRKQQVADWRNREAREARTRRSEMRKRHEKEQLEAESENKIAKVHFEDG